MTEGLSSDEKFLLPKYFYDERGSLLFEEICKTPEYYPTRTEISILKNLSGTISERNKDKNFIAELGSGTSLKTNYILKSFLETRDKLFYNPIDVSNILVESSIALTQKYDKLCIDGIISFYEEGMDFIVSRDDSPKLILFLGSSIGNFDEKQQLDFMKMMSNDLSIDDRLLIGFDMQKDKKILEAAYNDSQCITAEFNLNILRRINKELGGNFDTGKFEHSAFFNDDRNRIEMHLIAKESVFVTVDAIEKVFFFRKGESIHTENSYKFTYEMINELSVKSGFEFSDYYTDEKGYFSLCTFRKL